MLSILLIVVQIVLAFFIASSLYLIGIYYLKISLGSIQKHTETTNKKNHHFAIVFNDYINEESLLEQIQFLTNQSYTNFSAYFFIDTPYVTGNNMSHIRIIRPLQKRLGKFGLLNLSKNYFADTTEAILVLDPGAHLSDNYLHEMNTCLCQGFRVIQSDVQIDPSQQKTHVYQVFAKKFNNFIDRKVHQASGISSALWNQGFVIHASLFEKLNFDSYTNSDKVLQAELITRSEKIAYATKARLIERAYSSKEMFKQKQKWYQQYFFNYHLGFNLFLEGIKNPNIEKIIFGFNFMRPPLMIMFLASISLATIDLLWLPEFVFFFWLSALGLITSLFLLYKPEKLFSYIYSVKSFWITLFAVPKKTNKKNVDKILNHPNFAR
ncbi:MAG: hypothetical protein H7296_00145 [Bacteroidia bacterium]|nr:hypothetical protein [Bacteroidia bacterium]